MPTLSAVFKLYDGYTRTISNVITGTDRAASKILKASGATDTFNTELEGTGTKASLAASGIGKLATAIVSLAAIKKGMDISDTYVNTTSRLNLMNDGLQTTAELQEKIFASAQRSRGTYTAMAGSIAKMGILAGDAFSSNDELVGFSELVQKSFKIGGADPGEQSAGLHQLTQAMASGRLQGDEFRSITENAPMIAIAIAKATGKSKGDLKQMSADGVITSEIIKKAMFMMSDDINDKFKKMPRTFGDIWNDISNRTLKKFEPTMQRVSELINSPKFDTLTDGLIDGVNSTANGVLWLVNSFADLAVIIEENKEQAGFFASILGGAMLGQGVSKVFKLAQGFTLAGSVIGIAGAATGGLIYAWITFSDVFDKTLGGIYGTTYVVVGALTNAFIGVGYTIDNIVKGIFNGFVWLANATIDILNNLPGIELGKSDYWGGLMPENPFLNLNDEWDTGFQNGSYASNGMTMGIGEALGDLTSFFNKDISSIPLIPEIDYGTYGGGISGPLEVSGKNGKAVEVDVSKQDLKYLKDIAEREYINKFSTATLAPNIQVSFGDIKETADADQVAKRIQKILREEIATVAEG